VSGSADLSYLPLLVLPIAAAAWLALNRVLFRDLFSPFGLFFPAWLAPLILQSANLSDLDTPWALRSVVLVTWVTFAMAATCLITVPAIPDSRSPEVRSVFAEGLAAMRGAGFLLSLVVCYALTFTVYLYVEFLTNPSGIPLISVVSSGRLQSSAAHRWGKDSPLTAITGLLFVLTPVAYFAYRANEGRRGRVLLLLLSGLFPFFGILKLSRGDVFMGVVTVGLAAAYSSRFVERRPRRAPWLWYGVPAALATLVLYFMMTLRISGAGVTELYAHIIRFRPPGEGALYGFAGAVYGYFGLPFENLHRFLEAGDGSLHPGVSVLRPFLSLAGHGNLADRIDARVNYPAPASPAAGSATFLTGVYADSGLVGMVLIPVLYAALVNLIYLRMRARPSLMNLLLYVNFAYPWVWLFFNNAFGVLNFYLNAAFIVALSLLVLELRAPGRIPREAPT
jgi:hypothetical protein